MNPPSRENGPSEPANAFAPVAPVAPVALVSGGTFGIGRAITLALAREGYRVVAFGLESRQPGSSAEQGIAATLHLLQAEGLEAQLIEADVSNEIQVGTIVAETLKNHGPIDALVNNAAIHPRGDVLTTDPSLWRRVLEVNLTGPYLCSRAVLPAMIANGGGAIVNIGSGAGWGKPDLAAYAASKGGLHALTQAMAYDHLHQHIRVNMVIPGGTASGMTTEGMQAGHWQRARQTVSGDFNQPEDIAAAVVFLLSDQTRQVSGTVIDVGCFHHQGGPIPSAEKDQF